MWRVKEIFWKVIIPLVVIGLLLLMFLPVCRKDGQIDYFLLWILVGCPFGIRKMFVWIIPRGFDISGTVGVVAFNFIIGGLIGGVVAVYTIIKAAFCLITMPFRSMELG